MTFEQPASLNRFVAEPLPVTWQARWKWIRFILPLLVFITFCYAETFGLNLWKQGRFELSLFAPVFLIPIILLGALLIGNEIRMRNAWRSERCLNILEKGIGFRRARRPFIRWKKVVAFWFEDISGEAQFSKVTVEYFGDRKTMLPLRYSLVLDKHTQCPALISGLNLLRQKNGLKYRLEPDSSPPVRPVARNALLGMMLSVAGLFLLLHGVPLLLVSATHHSDESHRSGSSPAWSPGQREKFHAFVNAHFSSQTELRSFIFIAGSALTAGGIALLVCGKMIQRPKKGTAHSCGAT